MVLTTGIVVEERLQGFNGPIARDRTRRDMSLLPRVVPRWEDHLAAADLRRTYRRRGAAVGTIDALIAAPCAASDLRRRTADRGCGRVARLSPRPLA